MICEQDMNEQQLELDAETKTHGGQSLLTNGLEGAYGAKALEILLAMARLAAGGKSLTIAADWGFGSATVVDQDGAHTHVGCDSAGDERANFEAFVSQLHGLLVGKRGLSWVKPSNVELTGVPPTDATKGG